MIETQEVLDHPYLAFRKRDSEKSSEDSIIAFHSFGDYIVRLLIVGYFLIDSYFRAVNFNTEVHWEVMSAFKLFPREFITGVHFIFILLSIMGSILFFLSGFYEVGSRSLQVGANIMILFQLYETWIWEIWPHGIVSHVDLSNSETQNFLVHLGHNFTLIGVLCMIKKMAFLDEKSSSSQPTKFEHFLLSLRPWSYAASIFPLLVTSAVLRSRMSFGYEGFGSTALLVISVVFMHTSANLMNTYTDYASGCDTNETSFDRGIVDGLISQKSALKWSVVFLLCFVCSFAIIVAWSISSDFYLPVFLGALVGPTLAILYTWGPVPLKYIGLGDIVVFVCFGPLLVSYAIVGWCSKTEVINFAIFTSVFMKTLPTVLFVVAILHANNLRDIDYDMKAKVLTVANILGKRGSCLYFSLLTLGAHILSFCIALNSGCMGMMFCLTSLPYTLWLNWNVFKGEVQSNFPSVVECAAKNLILFGMGTVLGIVFYPFYTVEISGASFIIGVNILLHFLL